MLNIFSKYVSVSLIFKAQAERPFHVTETTFLSKITVTDSKYVTVIALLVTVHIFDININTWKHNEY